MSESRETVLIVDDLSDNLLLLRDILQDEYEVMDASSGQAALAIAGSTPAPDLILLDVMMPGMDGYQVCQALKANPQSASIPIIFVTGLTDVEDEALGFELGAVDYIFRPYSVPTVRARVATQLALHNQNRRLAYRYEQKNLELIEKNVQLMREIYEREQLESSLRESQESLRKLNSYIQTVREDEKSAIAREIHDELGGTLTALKFSSAWVAKHIPEGHQVLLDKVTDMTHLVDDSVATIRRIVTELRPTILDDLGLWAAIDWQVSEFRKRIGIDYRIDIECDSFQPDRHQSNSLFRVVQESLTNVARHASATGIEVDGRCIDNILRLSIRDNGIGITPADYQHNDSHGIRGMRERIKELGGTIEIDGASGMGTAITILLPIAQPQTSAS